MCVYTYKIRMSIYKFIREKKHFIVSHYYYIVGNSTGTRNCCWMNLDKRSSGGSGLYSNWCCLEPSMVFSGAG